MAFSLVFLKDSWACRQVGLWLCLLLGFCWFTLFNFNVMVFVLSYFIFVMFCCCLLETCSFLRRERVDGRGDGEELGGAEEGNCN